MNIGSLVSVSFLIIVATFIALALLFIERMGLWRLESSAGIERDGLPLGRKAPQCMLQDLEGRTQYISAVGRWQVLVFADRCLGSFLDLVAGINKLVITEPNLEVLVLSRDEAEVARIVARVLGLQVPVVSVDKHFYDSFGVRVMPYAMSLNPEGYVKWKGLVNTETELLHMWRMAQAYDPNQAAFETSPA